MKGLFSKIKAAYDAHKIIMFIVSFFVIGTNAVQYGVQDYTRSEPEKVSPPIAKPIIKQKPTIIKQIIYKTDKEYCRKLIKAELLKHYDSSRH